MLASLTYVGTATTVLHLGSFTLLTDPNFLHQGQWVHLGYGLVSRRRTQPAMSIPELPELDGVLLSHLHGDHFDRVARRNLARELPVITTTHAQQRLSRWGFGASVGLDTWQRHELSRNGQRLRITSVPGQHGPSGFHRLLPPVMGSVLDLCDEDGHTLRVYVTGDTLRRPMLRQIRERIGEIDVMVAHLGGTRVLGVLVTMDDGQGADLMEMIDPKLTIPVHYDDYGVFRSPLSHFITELHQRGLKDRVRCVLRGETVPLTAASVDRPASVHRE